MLRTSVLCAVLQYYVMYINVMYSVLCPVYHYMCCTSILCHVHQYYVLYLNIVPYSFQYYVLYIIIYAVLQYYVMYINIMCCI